MDNKGMSLDEAKKHVELFHEALDELAYVIAANMPQGDRRHDEAVGFVKGMIFNVVDSFLVREWYKRRVEAENFEADDLHARAGQ